MHVSEAIVKRESCRNFADRPVEREKLLACFEAARIAPSACNSQPWSYVAVTNRQVAAQVSPLLQGLGMNKFTESCPVFVVVCEGKATLSARLGGKVKDQYYAPIDIGLSAMQFCLTATELGLSTCIIGWFDEPQLKELLAIPDNMRVRLVLAVGYAATDALRQKVRKPFEEIVRFVD